MLLAILEKTSISNTLFDQGLHTFTTCLTGRHLSLKLYFFVLLGYILHFESLFICQKSPEKLNCSNLMLIFLILNHRSSFMELRFILPRQSLNFLQQQRSILINKSKQLILLIIFWIFLFFQNVYTYPIAKWKYGFTLIASWPIHSVFLKREVFLSHLQ